MVATLELIRDMLPKLTAAQPDMPSKGKMLAMKEYAALTCAALDFRRSQEEQWEPKDKVKATNTFNKALTTVNAPRLTAPPGYHDVGETVHRIVAEAKTMWSGHGQTVVDGFKTDIQEQQKVVEETSKGKMGWKTELKSTSQLADYENAAEESGIYEEKWQTEARDLIGKYEDLMLVEYHNACADFKIKENADVLRKGKAALLDLKVVVAEGKILEHLKVKAKKAQLKSLKANIESQNELKRKVHPKVPRLPS
jgi:hypothetical protein